MIQLELTNKTTTIRLKKYLDSTTDWRLHLTNIHDKQKKNYLISKKGYKFAK